jgi:hypothetical protein
MTDQPYSGYEGYDPYTAQQQPAWPAQQQAYPQVYEDQQQYAQQWQGQTGRRTCSRR